jgi:hypothetical protein
MSVKRKVTVPEGLTEANAIAGMSRQALLLSSCTSDHPSIDVSLRPSLFSHEVQSAILTDSVRAP